MERRRIARGRLRHLQGGHDGGVPQRCSSQRPARPRRVSECLREPLREADGPRRRAAVQKILDEFDVRNGAEANAVEEEQGHLVRTHGVQAPEFEETECWRCGMRRDVGTFSNYRSIPLSLNGFGLRPRLSNGHCKLTCTKHCHLMVTGLVRSPVDCDWSLSAVHPMVPVNAEDQ